MEREQVAMVVRAEVQRLGRRGPGRRYPAQLRTRIGEYVRRSKAAGASLEQVARELGLRPRTLSRWAGRSAQAAPFVPVTVVPDVPRQLLVHGPRGLRVEGLDVAGLAELIARLG